MGNVRAVIADGKNFFGQAHILSYADYYPFGAAMPGHSLNADLYRYSFQGQEKDGETGLLAFELRMYDPNLGRWQVPDPYGQYWSPYVGMGNNPVNGIEIQGGLFVNFDTNGNLISITHNNFFHNLFLGRKGRIVDSNGKIDREFTFADPKSDVNSIISGIITKIIVVKPSQVVLMLVRAGVFDKENKLKNFPLSYRSPLNAKNTYIYKNSEGGGIMDFSATQIPKVFNKDAFIDTHPIDNKTDALFLVDDDQKNVAHNHFNFGNFLWGAAGTALGYSEIELSIGAHYNSIKNSEKNGYVPQLDSRDDQYSIFLGAFYAHLHGFEDMFFHLGTEEYDDVYGTGVIYDVDQPILGPTPEPTNNDIPGNPIPEVIPWLIPDDLN